MSKQKKDPELSSLPLDDQFTILLHKKIMFKQGAARRRTKKYYTDQYKKTGLIPEPLLLANQGIMDGRKCSGRKPVLTKEVKERFKEMIEASSDLQDTRFIFITQPGRKIKNYHKWLEEEFSRPISLAALHRYCRQENLQLYLKKEDYDDDKLPKTYFNPVPIFDLVQMDGCVFQYLKIRNAKDLWQKPQVIEFYDTGSRYMFVLDLYFSESSLNSVDLFTDFLLNTPFPDKTIRIRPDRAKGFVNLKRPIHELNLKHSIMPEGFFLAPDFSRRRAPKDKVHLESSHRSLHSFEIRIIKEFQSKIVKTVPGIIFKKGKMKKITVTFLDITIEQLRQSGLIETYRREHNETTHRFSVAGKTKSFCPGKKLRQYLEEQKTIVFTPADVQEFMKYGFKKEKATVHKDKTITYKKQKYYVAVGTEKFSSHSSTKVHVSYYQGKLFIFDYAHDGILLGEAVCQGPSKTPEFVAENLKKRVKANEIEKIAAFLEKQGMKVKMDMLVARYRKGMNFDMAKEIYQSNKARYDKYESLLKESPEKISLAVFNAFLNDCDRSQRSDLPIPYAFNKGE